MEEGKSVVNYTTNTVVFDTSFANFTSLTSTAKWFNQCSYLFTIIGIENLKTDNVTDMSGMFNGCSGLKSLDVSGFKTDNVTNMDAMFNGCSSLTSLDVSGFNTDKVKNMGRYITSIGMFTGCSSLKTLDLSSFKTDNVTNMSYMFYYCSELTTIYVSDGWSTEKVTNGGSMFTDCAKLVGGQGTAWDSNYTDHTYACIDGGAVAPGYLTYKAAQTVVKGDVNGDGTVDVADIAEIIDIMAASARRQ